MFIQSITFAKSRDLRILISKVFPQEVIKKEYTAKISELNIAKLGFIPLNWVRKYYLLPVKIVETNKKIYIDGRMVSVQDGLFFIFIGPIFLTAALLVFNNFSILSLSGMIVPAIVLPVIGGLLQILMSSDIANVLFIKNEWIAEKTGGERSLTMRGKIPSGEISNIAYQLYNPKSSLLASREKWFSQHVMSTPKTPLTQHFIIHFRDIDLVQKGNSENEFLRK